MVVAWQWASVDAQFDLDDLRARYPALQVANDTANVSINGLKGTPLMVGDTLYLSTPLSQVAAIDAANVGRNDRLPPSGDPGTYNDFWWERGTALTRTALVVDPPEGRLPERTVAGDVRARWSRGVDSWTDRSLAERCVTRGAPKRPGGYNNNFLVLQT